MVRAEEQKDRSAVRAVNVSAFPTSAEADLVDVLREQADPMVSLVAEEDGVVIGHVLFSPVSLPDHPALKIMGLGPVAVLPTHQRKGVGLALTQAGLEQCRSLGFGAVVVLGHPEYYPRFGFSPSVHFGIGCKYEVPVEAFMALELQPDYLRGASGTIQYHAAFDNV